MKKIFIILYLLSVGTSWAQNTEVTRSANLAKAEAGAGLGFFTMLVEHSANQTYSSLRWMDDGKAVTHAKEIAVQLTADNAIVLTMVEIYAKKGELTLQQSQVFRDAVRKIVLVHELIASRSLRESTHKDFFQTIDQYPDYLLENEDYFRQYRKKMTDLRSHFEGLAQANGNYAFKLAQTKYLVELQVSLDLALLIHAYTKDLSNEELIQFIRDFEAEEGLWKVYLAKLRNSLDFSNSGVNVYRFVKNKAMITLNEIILHLQLETRLCLVEYETFSVDRATQRYLEMSMRPAKVGIREPGLMEIIAKIRL